MDASNLITPPFPLPNRNIARVSNRLSLEGGKTLPYLCVQCLPTTMADKSVINSQLPCMANQEAVGDYSALLAYLCKEMKEVNFLLSN